jgi:hypothetical protein
VAGADRVRLLHEALGPGVHYPFFHVGDRSCVHGTVRVERLPFTRFFSRIVIVPAAISTSLI